MQRIVIKKAVGMIADGAQWFCLLELAELLLMLAGVASGADAGLPGRWWVGER